MRSSCTPFRIALLGSVFAVAALTPAVGASHLDSQRMRALFGDHPPVQRSNGAAAPVQADPTYTVLHDFAGAPGDGADSGADVTLDDLGNIYGTTDFGGSSGDGVIFKLAPDGTETLLHTFTGPDGSAPDGAVMLTAKGDLYGTTGSGGASGNGVLFKLTAKGKFRKLHDFATNDGAFLRGRLIRDKLGNIYGTALFGGTNGDGTVFRYGFDGTFTVLHTFNGSDGEFPEHGVVRDSAGNLYGVTAFGGTGGNGTVFKIATDGTFSTVRNFTGGSDGGFLYGGLAIDKAGNLYGSTGDGGTSGAGTVFKLAADGTLTTLYDFTGGADGANPSGDMLLAGTRLYSVTNQGGDPDCQCGVIYEITSKGRERVLHTFTGSDGAAYSAGLTKSNGTFYGTASSGGTDGVGVVFSVTEK
jgi:uncharacterized repeat protein (TIGR03803 family)